MEKSELKSTTVEENERRTHDCEINSSSKSDADNDNKRNGCRKVRDHNSAFYRYLVLFIICLCGVGDYFCLDNPAALESNILCDLHITETEYVGFYSFSSWPSAVMCVLCGFLIDRALGVRLGIGLFSWPVSIGQGLFAAGAFVNKYWLMCVGRIMFALAGTPFSVSTQKLTAKWLQGGELTMAFGLRVSVARVGSVVNMNVMQPIYTWFSRHFHGYQNLGMALYIGVIICVVSFLAGLVVCLLDKRAESNLELTSKVKKSFRTSLHIESPSMLFCRLAGTPFSVSTQKLTAKWLQGGELTMAFGLRVSVARVGSVVNMNVMQPIYTWFSRHFHGYQNLGMALYIGVIICVVSFLAGLVVCLLDKRAESNLELTSKVKKSKSLSSELF